MDAISLEHVSFSYKSHGQIHPVLSEMNLAVSQGTFACVLGGSGCGKSTLLRLIAGLETPEQGRILVNGRPLAGPGPDRAMVFQDHALFPWMTARENVQFGIRQAKRGLSRFEVRETAEDFLEKVGMADAMEQYPCQLSGGMRQRTAIARALAMDTDLLLMDEPFAALDVRNRQQLQGLLERLWNAGSRRKTVVFVTHSIPEAVCLADRVLFLDRGRVTKESAVGLPRPRTNLTGADTVRLDAIQQAMMGWFYEDKTCDAEENRL